MTRRFCDLCGKEILIDYKTKWKMKYYCDKPLTTASGWCKIDAHEECLKAVAKEAQLRGVKI